MKRRLVVTGLLLWLFVLIPSFAWSEGVAPTGLRATDGTTLVPIRYIAEWLGATVDFDASTDAITLQTGTVTICLALNSSKATIGERECRLQTPVMGMDGTTYVPLRFVAEALGAGVAWDNWAQQATITHPTTGEVLKVTVAGDIRPTAVTPRKAAALDGRTLLANYAYKLPSLTTALSGGLEFFVENPNDTPAIVGMRKGKAGANLAVDAYATESMWLPAGTYSFYLVYGNEPEALYKGDDVDLEPGYRVGVRLQLVSNGNFGLYRVN